MLQRVCCPPNNITVIQWLLPGMKRNEIGDFSPFIFWWHAPRPDCFFSYESPRVLPRAPEIGGFAHQFVV